MGEASGDFIKTEGGHPAKVVATTDPVSSQGMEAPTKLRMEFL